LNLEKIKKITFKCPECASSDEEIEEEYVERQRQARAKRGRKVELIGLVDSELE
jgi:hypothetical protein